MQSAPAHLARPGQVFPQPAPGEWAAAATEEAEPEAPYTSPPDGNQ